MTKKYFSKKSKMFKKIYFFGLLGGKAFSSHKKIWIS